ncbi:MAG: lysoplasmalogenase [Acidimicrobiales bacterium]
MTTVSQIVLGLVGIVAAADWYALTTRNRRLERVAKPLVMVGLLIAVAASNLEGWPLLWLCLGLVAGLVGDVLLLPEIDQFLGGLGAFLIGHLAYVGLAMAFGVSTSKLVVGLVLMTALVLTVGTKITEAVRGSALFVPVVAYVITIGASTALLIGTGRWWMALGAVLFAVSDSLLGWTRFVAPIAGGRVAVHVTYHLGQALITIGAIT